MISYFIDILFKIIYLIIFVFVLLSWIPIFDLRKEPLASLYKIYEAIMKPFRAIIPPIGGVIDISPVLAFILLGFIQQCLSRILIPLGL